MMHDVQRNQRYQRLFTQGRLDEILLMAGAMKATRQRADTQHVVNADDVPFLPNQVMQTSKDIENYRDVCNEKDIPLGFSNQYRILKMMADKEFFDKLPMFSFGLTHCMHAGKQFYGGDQTAIDTVVATELLGKKSSRLTPIVYMKASLCNDAKRFRQQKKHMDAHALTLAFTAPEQVYGYKKSKEGTWQNSADWFLRLAVDERVATLEAGQTVAEELPPRRYLDITPREEKQFDALAQRVDQAIRDTAKEVNAEDLSALLRVIPVRAMPEILPQLVEVYSLRGTLPRYEPTNRNVK